MSLYPRTLASRVPRAKTSGGWVKGQSGNPGGRPKALKKLILLARKHGPDIIRKLHRLTSDPDGRVAVAACRELLDRGYGKSAQIVGWDPLSPPIQLQAVEMSRDQLLAIAAQGLPALPPADGLTMCATCGEVYDGPHHCREDDDGPGTAEPH